MADSPHDRLKNMQSGLHLAMEALIRNKDYREAERVLRILDVEMANLIDDLRKAK